MTYALFDPAVPDVSTDTRKEAIDNARHNLTALADMLAAFAGMQGFDVAIVTSTSDGPTEVTATNGTQIVKKVITYGTSGVTDGLPVTCDYSKSTNGGSSYDSIATQTFNYDGSGNFTDYAWS
jgi:hypothetical protein